MKKIFTTIVCLLSLFSASAQYQSTATETAVTHLTFKGLRIDGTPENFSNKLESLGYTFSSNIDDGEQLYKGNFSGHDCSIYVCSHNKLMYEVVVGFPDVNNWETLYNYFTTYKNLLTTKYGECSKTEETFINTPSTVNINQDEAKFEEAKNMRCRYYAIFIVNSYEQGYGYIKLEIQPERIAIRYVDIANENIVNDLKKVDERLADL